MIATDPAQPLSAGWSRVIVQFRNASSFFDMPSATLDKRLSDFEEYCGSASTPMALPRFRYTRNGAVAVGLIAEESMSFGSVMSEVVCTAALWMYVFQEPISLPVVPDLTKENRRYLEHFIQRDGGFILNAVAGANDAWSFSVVACLRRAARLGGDAGSRPADRRGAELTDQQEARPPSIQWRARESRQACSYS